MGTVEAIYISGTAAAPTKALDAVLAIPGVGLEGDRYALKLGTFYKPLPDYELTLIEAEAVEAMRRDYGVELAPGDARRNLVDARSCAEPPRRQGIHGRGRSHSRHPPVRAVRSFGEVDGQASPQRPAPSRRLACTDFDRRHDTRRCSRSGSSTAPGSFPNCDP